MTQLRFDMAFPDEASCWKLLEATRWTKPTCNRPTCGSVGDASTWVTRPHRWQCRLCGRQFHAALGTPIAGSHLPLRSWFLAIYLLDLDPHLPVAELAQRLDVTPKTAASVYQRIGQLRLRHAYLIDAVLSAVRPPVRRRGRIRGSV